MSNGKKAFVYRLNDNGQGPELLKQVFVERGWLEYDEDEQHESDWNLWWRTSRFRMGDYENTFVWQRLNHYPKSTGITRKDCLVRHLKRMKGVHGASVFNFSPLSFNLPNDYTRYIAEYGKMKAKLDSKLFSWICKPADMSRGRGIFVFRDISELQYDCNAVVQQYIANPLLIAGYKFDMRLYVAVPSFHPLTVYMFQEGIVRFSTEKFDMSTLNNVFAHLTNTSINKYGPAYQADKERIGPGCKWTLNQLRHYLHQNNIDDRMIWAKVINIIILTLLIQAPMVPKEGNCYELYGFDILIDENLKPWLLEVNFSPALSTDCQTDVSVKKPMLHNLIDMLNFRESDTERGGVDKHASNARPQVRGRMSAGKSRPEPVDRNSASSRLSHRGSMQRANTTISTMMKSVDSMMIEHQVSFIHQDNPSIDKINEEKMCFGLPLVNPSDDDKLDSSRSSSASDIVEAATYGTYSYRSGHVSPTSTVLASNYTSQLTSDTRNGSFDRSTTTVSSVVKKTDSVQSHGKNAEKSSLKSLGNSDSAYSSFSDNSDKVTMSSSNNRSKLLGQKKKGYSLQSEVLSETQKESEFQIKSLRPTENSKSLMKVSNRGTVPRTAPRQRNVGSKSVLKTRSFDRATTRSHVTSRLGNSTMRSDTSGLSVNKSHTGISSVATTSRTAMDKDTTGLTLTGIAKKPSTTNIKTRQLAKSISVHNKPPKGPPPKVGEFFLVFPFNEGTFKAANATLDPHVVIKETQKYIKDVKAEIDRNPEENKTGGHLPFGSAPDAERLWAPLKHVEES